MTIAQYHVHDFPFKAQISGNPFDVELQGKFIGPNGEAIFIPAFYDGENTWKIRFSPPVTGRWSILTLSPVAALNGKRELEIIATPNMNPAVHGALRVDPVNRHHFLYEDGSRYFLMGYEAD